MPLCPGLVSDKCPVSVLQAEAVCFGQGFILWLAWAVPITRLGALLVLTSIFSMFTTHCLFLPLLALLGPHGATGPDTHTISLQLVC